MAAPKLDRANNSKVVLRAQGLPQDNAELNENAGHEPGVHTVRARRSLLYSSLEASWPDATGWSTSCTSAMGAASPARKPILRMRR